MKKSYQRNESSSVVRNIVNRFLLWRERSLQRKKLSTLPDHILKDIGVTRSDALNEINKSFWKE